MKRIEKSFNMLTNIAVFLQSSLVGPYNAETPCRCTSNYAC